MTVTEQFLTGTDKMLVETRDDIVAISYTTGNIDGTETHAVRRTEWISGNVNGTSPMCNGRRSVREISLGHRDEVTCSKCLKRAAR